MWAVDGKKSASIAQSIITIEPAFSSTHKDMIISALDAGETTLIANGADLDAAFGSLPDSLKKAALEFGRSTWRCGVLPWRRRTEQVLHLLQRAGSDIPLVRLIQLLFTLDLRATDQLSTLDLSSTVIPGHLLLRDLSVSGDVYLDGLRVMGACDTRGLKVGRGISGEQAHFLGPIWIANCQIEKTVRFGYSQFHSNIDASDTVFSGGLWLRYANAQGDVDFSNCIFGSDSSFGACRYGGAAKFDRAKFQDTASFEGATFQSKVSLDEAVFAGRVFFREATFKTELSHQGTRFLGEVVPPLHTVTPPKNIIEEQVTMLRDEFKAR